MSLRRAALGLLATFIASTAMAQTSPESKTCSGNFFLEKCKDQRNEPLDLRKSQSDADGVIFNYSLIGNRAHYEEISNFNRNASADLNSRARGIAEEVRKAAMSYVTGETSEETWSEELKSIVTRLRTVEFKIADRLDSACSEQGDPGIPNASYTSSIHTIEICPAQVKSTTQDIAASIAHELGHVVSPCATQSALIKNLPPTPTSGACLLKIGEGSERSEEEKKFFGSGPILIERKSEYAVDVDPPGTDDRVRCGAAVRLPGSAMASPQIYRSIRACLEKRYAGDYENWMAMTLFNLEKMPKRFDTLPGPAAKEWPKQVEELKQSTPLVCYRKLDEHFSDSFGGQVYSKWSQAHDQTAKQIEIGLHFLTGVQCVEKQTGKIRMQRDRYPSVEDRIALFLKPRAVSNLLRCAQPATDPICALNEESFTPAAPKSGSESSGTKR